MFYVLFFFSFFVLGFSLCRGSRRSGGGVGTVGWSLTILVTKLIIIGFVSWLSGKAI